MNRDPKTYVLACDIGGTKTNLGLFSAGKDRPVLVRFGSYSSRGVDGLESLVERFIQNHPDAIAGACFAVAGPVVHGTCRTTNLPWNVSERSLAKRFGWRHVRLVNDLVATAEAVCVLRAHEKVSLNRARIRKGANMALMAPGTGLGTALVVFAENGGPVIISSEGGHGDFSPNNREEADLWRYLHEHFGHVSLERVLSGPGLYHIYSWLKESGRYKEPVWLAERMRTNDPAQAISQAAMTTNQPLCTKTLQMFTAMFGAAAGNLALTAMTFGGVYLAGGIPPKILPVLKSKLFINAFTAKGRFRDVLEKIPVKIILNDKAPLLGAARMAFQFALCGV